MIDVMNEMERGGLSIRSALLAHGRQSVKRPEAFVPTPQPMPSGPAAAPGFKSSIKRALRPAAAALYKLAKPVLRPLAFRLRAYLLTPMLAEQQRSTQAVQEQLRQLATDLQGWRAENARSLERQQNEVAAIGLQLLQELDVVRDALTRTVQESALEPALPGSSVEALKRIEQYSSAAASRVAVPGAPGEVLVRTPVGYVLCDASDYPLLSILVEAGELEKGTRLLIQKLLRPGDTFIDIGANIGMHTLGAARAMKGAGRIIAFEPHPITHALLGKSLLLNGFARVTETHQAAVSNHAGRMALHLGQTSGHHSLYPLEGESPGAARIDVPLVKLDDVVADLPVDLIKIDVEGAELDVLAGAAATIVRNAELALIVEYGGSHLRRTGHTPADWLRAFEAHGFIFRAIEPETGVLLDWSPAQIDAVDSINLLFARPASKAWARAREKT